MPQNSKKIELLYLWTEDNLRLPGIHYLPKNKSETCLLITHGMSGNILENYFAHVLGNLLAENNIACIYGHNRGYNHINDILKRKKDNPSKTDYSTVRCGATFERFTDCLFDIDVWLSFARKAGYKKVVLLGHSLGCNKTIYYFAKRKPKEIIGVVLASPPDMVGLFELPRYQPNHQKLLAEARKNIRENNPRKLVSGMVWDWYNISSQTYLDLSEPEGPADNLPILRKPHVFPQLAEINVPILGIMGENDDIEIRNLGEDLHFIAGKATNSPKFTEEIIPEANHTYDFKELEFAKTVLNWINNLEVVKKQ